jgi:hypothetical protein
MQNLLAHEGVTSVRNTPKTRPLLRAPLNQ